MKTAKRALRLCAAWLCLAPLATAETPAPEADAGPMTQARMETILRELAAEARGIPGMLEFEYAGVELVCISDLSFGRMRIVSPITPVAKLTSEQVGSILEANFHTALDARYATSHGVLYAAFIHPMASLTEAELRSAVRQVASLASSFGTEYTSGELVYGGGQPL